MQKLFKPLALIVAIYGSNVVQLVHAQDSNVELGRVNIELSGIVTLATCGVLSSEQDKYVQLGSIASKDLPSVGSQSKETPIHFEMSNCPPNGTVTLTFEGNRDTNNAELLAIDALVNKAENVAIEIRSEDKKRLALGQKSEAFSTNSDGHVSALFYANYIVTKAQAQAGKANANAQFTIEYQ
ncbi:fimbrial protein [Acinetobacter bereziniae]|jgi:minor fimbrial subunit|uniref:fimbrial protein n=1 Tax=Acinetobacter TaxID=469 RepID=UPI0011177709|nr:MULTISPECIES: fimbrial protein [Acinetobacter]MBJ8553243.1 fimbrial protein [Acinetobacter bereziniae]MBJ9904731.1 fimbrial protein [Acinetobacter bereziniae]MBJ9948622.1 fimbrial protein [Acinetobacter bereziniae]MCM8513178.1 fimbrial protein [Acinetobacter bereziniae]MCU4318974.1 fimbrial protein [Acinetobacter bereziniae]